MPSPSTAMPAALLAVLALTGQPAGATTWDAPLLAAIPPSEIGHVAYEAPDGSPLVLDVLQDRPSTGSMGGSSSPGRQGLALGQDQLGSRYLLLFSQPLTRLSLDFVALSSAAGQAESLRGFDVFGPVGASITLDSPDGSAGRVGGAVVALSAEGRGRISFVAPGQSPFDGLAFFHEQPAALGGFVITRIQASVVPEPASAATWLLGLAMLGASARRPRSAA